MDTLQVLIIEDDKDTANFFNFVLSLVGFDCDVVYNAKQALSRLSVVEPDIILLDMRLGSDINGEDILHQIRSNPRFDKTRVIVTTAYPSMAESITNLVDLILVKPIEVEQLQNLAERLVTHRRPTPRMYYHDPVTGIYNQTFFHIRLEHAIERAKLRADFLFAVFVFKIKLIGMEEDHIEYGIFKSMFREIAERLKVMIRPADTIAHLAEGKFASLHEELKGPEDVPIIIDRIQQKLASPYIIHGKSYNLVIELGAVIHDRRYQKAEEILSAAEDAMALAIENDHENQKIVVSYGKILK